MSGSFAAKETVSLEEACWPFSGSTAAATPQARRLTLPCTPSSHSRHARDTSSLRWRRAVFFEHGDAGLMRLRGQLRIFSDGYFKPAIVDRLRKRLQKTLRITGDQRKADVVPVLTSGVIDDRIPLERSRLLRSRNLVAGNLTWICDEQPVC